MFPHSVEAKILRHMAIARTKSPKTAVDVAIIMTMTTIKDEREREHKMFKCLVHEISEMFCPRNDGVGNTN